MWLVGFGMLVLFQVLLMYVTAFGHGNYDPFAEVVGLEKARGFWRFRQRHYQLSVSNYDFMGLHWWVFGTAQPMAAAAVPRA